MGRGMTHILLVTIDAQGLIGDLQTRSKEAYNEW